MGWGEWDLGKRRGHAVISSEIVKWQSIAMRGFEKGDDPVLAVHLSL